MERCLRYGLLPGAPRAPRFRADGFLRLFVLPAGRYTHVTARAFNRRCRAATAAPLCTPPHCCLPRL